MRMVLLLASVMLLAAGCSGRPLRGSVDPSSDGKTYLSVVDDDGGGCGALKVDGQIWTHGMEEAALIEPGTHTIECGGSITFDIPRGVVFRFDYWGP